MKDKSKTYVARFKAFVGYYFLLKGSVHAVKVNFRPFLKHFPRAMKDVANGPSGTSDHPIDLDESEEDVEMLDVPNCE